MGIGIYHEGAGNTRITQSNGDWAALCGFVDRVEECTRPWVVEFVVVFTDCFSAAAHAMRIKLKLPLELPRTPLRVDRSVLSALAGGNSRSHKIYPDRIVLQECQIPYDLTALYMSPPRELGLKISCDGLPPIASPVRGVIAAFDDLHKRARPTTRAYTLEITYATLHDPSPRITRLTVTEWHTERHEESDLVSLLAGAHAFAASEEVELKLEQDDNMDMWTYTRLAIPVNFGL
jgi:hypothetical protein